MQSPFKIVAFNQEFEREHFECESELLNSYLKKQASQDIKRRLATCFLAINQEQKVVAYYTLSSISVFLADLPEKIRRKLPRYPNIPAVLLGRLAVDKHFTRKGLGQTLVGNALKRVIRSEIAAYALIVEAKDEKSANFYLKLGFIPFIHQPYRLFFPLEKVRTLI